MDSLAQFVKSKKKLTPIICIRIDKSPELAVWANKRASDLGISYKKYFIALLEKDRQENSKAE